MKIIRKAKEMQSLVSRIRRTRKKIGFVPTMGALHRGHLELVSSANKNSDFTVVSIFVNPVQFGPGEDYGSYPRKAGKDIALLKSCGVDALFLPQVKEMYPQGFSTYVVPEGKFVETLCGAKRPRHFRGVDTVVAKLFNIVKPDIAFFGQKDAQQCAVIKRLVRDLNFDIDIRIVPTVREKDGLAMSSRNLRLLPRQRKNAAGIYRSLMAAKKMMKSGVTKTEKIRETIKKMITEWGGEIDYISFVNPETMEDLTTAVPPVMIAVAVRVGRVRLIDNIAVN